MRRFRLQKVLDLRIWREQERALRLGEARRRAEEAARELERLHAALAAGQERRAEAQEGGGKVGERRPLELLLDRLEVRIAEADAAYRAAEREVEASLRDYADAFRQRRVLEELRARFLEVLRQEEARAERKAMDDIAVTRHGRSLGSAGAPGGEGP